MLITGLIGNAKARQLMMTGESWSAEKASEIGLIDTIVDEKTLLAEAIEFADRFGERAYGPIRAIKDLTRSNVTGMRSCVIGWMRSIYESGDV